jgi:hypothetical protein
MRMARLVFVAQPDRYGRFGHQTFAMLSAVLLAHYCDEYFLPLRYEYFAHRFNNVVDYGASERSLVHLSGSVRFTRLDIPVYDQHGNTKLDLSDPCQFGELLNQINRIRNTNDDYVQLLLPFDQFPGHLLRHYNKQIKYDMQRVFNGLIQAPYRKKNKDPQYLVHVRRGDVSPQRHPAWYVPDEDYCKLIDALYLLHSGELSIVIVTQGSVKLASDACRELTSRNRLRLMTCDEQWTNDKEIDSVYAMMQADYIIGGLSSFSMLPAWIRYGSHSIAYRHRMTGTYPHPMRIRGEIFTDEDVISIVSKLRVITQRLDQCIV